MVKDMLTHILWTPTRMERRSLGKQPGVILLVQYIAGIVWSSPQIDLPLYKSRVWGASNAESSRYWNLVCYAMKFYRDSLYIRVNV